MTPIWPSLSLALAANMITLQDRASVDEFGGHNSIHNTSQCRKRQLFQSGKKSLVCWIPSTQWNVLTWVLWPVYFMEPCTPLAFTGAHTAGLINLGGSRADNDSVVSFLIFLWVSQFFLYQLTYSKQYISQGQILFPPPLPWVNINPNWSGAGGGGHYFFH